MLIQKKSAVSVTARSANSQRCPTSPDLSVTQQALYFDVSPLSAIVLQTVGRQSTSGQHRHNPDFITAKDWAYKLAPLHVVFYLTNLQCHSRVHSGVVSKPSSDYNLTPPPPSVVDYLYLKAYLK